MAQIITMGEVLVEIMAKNVGQRFDETGEFVGPFPSGAPGIFADQAAKCGSPTLIISAIGNDGFGAINLKRLKDDGVDISKVRVLDDETTGVAFVTYHANGSRDFLYHITNAACGRVDEDFIDDADFRDCNYLHVMGSSIYSEGMHRAVIKAMAYAAKHGSRLSFDPNVRKEIQRDEVARQRLVDILYQSHIIFAGEHELAYLTGVAEEFLSVQALLEKGAEIIIIKRGDQGATLYIKEQTYQLAAYPVEEVDPTGAGDCFAGTFVSWMNRGADPLKAFRLAGIAGAKAVTKRGPMEGTTTSQELMEIYRELYS